MEKGGELQVGRVLLEVGDSKPKFYYELSQILMGLELLYSLTREVLYTPEEKYSSTNVGRAEHRLLQTQ